MLVVNNSRIKNGKNFQNRENVRWENCSREKFKVRCQLYLQTIINLLLRASEALLWIWPITKLFFIILARAQYEILRNSKSNTVFVPDPPMKMIRDHYVRELYCIKFKAYPEPIYFRY